MIIEGIGFHHVDNVESVCLTSTCVANPKVVPLGISSRIIVWFQDQIIFKFIDLNCTTKISRFKSRFKY